jgi:hypothetical protein
MDGGDRAAAASQTIPFALGLSDRAAAAVRRSAARRRASASATFLSSDPTEREALLVIGFALEQVPRFSPPHASYALVCFGLPLSDRIRLLHASDGTRSGYQRAASCCDFCAPLDVESSKRQLPSQSICCLAPEIDGFVVLPDPVR